MKIAISAGNKKRQITGPYALCGSREDMLILQRALDYALEEERKFTYGWVDVSEHAPILSDTPPEPWE